MSNRKLSDQTLDLLNTLHALSASRWSSRRQSELCALIKAIGARAEMLASPALLELAWHADRGIAGEAARAIRALLADVAPHDLAFLDLSMRAARPWGAGAAPAAAIRALDVPRIQLADDGGEYVLGLASFHRDGFVREAATRALAASRSGEEIPFLLIRANDWVDCVRHVAVQALSSRADLKDAPSLVRSLPLITRLRALGRNDLRDLAQALENTVASEAAASALRAGIASTDRATRRECVKLAIALRKISLCLYALASADNMVRVYCARFLLGALPQGEACAVAGDLAADTFAAVRREALRCGIERCPQECDARLRSALLDSNVSVRGLAAFHARTTVALDAAAFYRSHMPGVSDRLTAASIVGLGECGTIADVPLLRSFLANGSPRVRRAVLQAIATLDGQGNADLFCAALVSAFAGESRKACEILIKTPSLAECSVLEKAMLASEHDHVRKNAFKVLVRTGKWSSVR